VTYGGNSKPELLTCLHEEQAVALAHGYAKVAGKPILVACHGTVGLQHAAMAIYNAWCDRVPMVIIGGNHLDASIRRPFIEWVHAAQDCASLVRDFTKWDDAPRSLQHFAESFVRSIEIATSPPMGPVVLIADHELQEDSMGEERPTIPAWTPPRPPQGEDGAVREAARLLVAADAPVIVADRLARSQDGIDRLIELAELLQAPVVDRGGRLNFPTGHYLNHTGRQGSLVAQADVILCLEVDDVWGIVNGVRDVLHRQAQRLARADAKLIKLGVSGSFLKSNYQDFERYAAADLSIVGNGEATLPSLIESIRTEMSEERRSSIAERQSGLQSAFLKMTERAVEDARYGWNEAPISTARLAMELWQAIKDRDWALVSGTNFQSFWPQRLWDFDRQYQYIGNSGGAGIGYGAPAAVGAALAHRGEGRLAVNIQSDGDMLYVPGAFWTAAHHKIPLLTVMHNNGGYHQEIMHLQRMTSQRRRGMDGNARVGNVFEDPPVDFAGMARSMGVWSMGPITEPGELAAALRQAIDVVEQGMPALVDIACQPR